MTNDIKRFIVTPCAEHPLFYELVKLYVSTATSAWNLPPFSKRTLKFEVIPTPLTRNGIVEADEASENRGYIADQGCDDADACQRDYEAYPASENRGWRNQ